VIEFDVETTGLQWYAADLFLVQFLLPEKDVPNVLEHPKDHGRIRELLSQNDEYRAWNTKFDLHFLKSAGYELPPPDRWHDGMVVAHLIDERRPVALKAVGEKMFGPAVSDPEKLVKGWLAEETKRRREISKRDGVELLRPNYSDVPPEIMHPYAAGDVELQRRIMDQLAPKLSDELTSVYELERASMAALFDMERRGMQIDVPAAEAFETQLEHDLDQVIEESKKLAGVATFNLGSGTQIGEALQRRGADLTFARTLKNGLPSTDEETLEAVDDELAAKILEFRKLDKLYGTYIHPMLHETDHKTFGKRAPFIANDGRIHSNFRQVGARTGRMSSSDPNVQNWHRDDLRMRHLVVPSEGNVLVSADLDSIELRLLAAFVGEGRLLEMMKDPDADLHTDTADRLGLMDFDRGMGIIESRRQRGKKMNYLQIYGGGVRTIRKNFRVNQAKAREYLRLYHEAYPEVGEFQNRIEFTLSDQGYVKSPYGRRHRVMNPRYAEREAYKFVNYLIQGTAADIIKIAAVAAHKAGIPMVSIVHDEILADVPKEDAEEAAHIIRQALITQPEITKIIPLDAEAKIVDRWSYAKDKNFVPNYERTD
jgi:DNA polymerase-1